MIPGQAIVGIILIVFAIVMLSKLAKDIIAALLVVGILIFGVFLVFGGMPGLGGVPKLGGLGKETPKKSSEGGLGGILSAIHEVAEGIKIVAVDKDAEGRLVVAVANTGQTELLRPTLFVNNNTITWINSPEIPIKAGDAVILQTNYKPSGNFTVEIRSGTAKDTYPREGLLSGL